MRILTIKNKKMSHTEFLDILSVHSKRGWISNLKIEDCEIYDIPLNFKPMTFLFKDEMNKGNDIKIGEIDKFYSFRLGKNVTVQDNVFKRKRDPSIWNRILNSLKHFTS